MGVSWFVMYACNEKINCWLQNEVKKSKLLIGDGPKKLKTGMKIIHKGKQNLRSRLCMLAISLWLLLLFFPQNKTATSNWLVHNV